MHRTLWIGVVMLAIITRSLHAQATWRLTLDAGATSFSSAAHDTNPDVTHLRPWHPTIYSIRVSRDAGKFGASLTLAAAGGPLGVNIHDFVLLDGTDLGLIEVAPEFRYRLASTSAGASVHLSAGPVIDVWMPEGEDPRTVYGGIGALTLSLPLAGSWLVDIRGDLAVTQSFITEEEENPGLIRDDTMRRGRVALGITKKL